MFQSCLCAVPSQTVAAESSNKGPAAPPPKTAGTANLEPKDEDEDEDEDEDDSDISLSLSLGEPRRQSEDRRRPSEDRRRAPAALSGRSGPSSRRPSSEGVRGEAAGRATNGHHPASSRCPDRVPWGGALGTRGGRGRMRHRRNLEWQNLAQRKYTQFCRGV